MSYVLTALTKKREVDTIIRDTIDKVLVLRFGRASDAVCLHLDDVVRTLSLSLHLNPLQKIFTRLNSIFAFFFLNLFISIQLCKSAREVSKFATVALVDIDSEEIQVYVKYFDITFIPSIVFFFNAHHMKMDSGYHSLFPLSLIL
jgi:hypothetical protein